MNTLLAILKVTDARCDVILAGGLYHRFLWRHLPLPPPSPLAAIDQVSGSRGLNFYAADVSMRHLV